MSYGVMYKEGEASVIRLFDSWDGAYLFAFQVGEGVHHPPVALYAIDNPSGLMVQVLTL